MTRKARSLELAAMLLVLAVGCSSNRPYVWVQQLPEESRADARAIRAGDEVYVLVAGQDNLSGDHQVREDGTIVQALMGRVLVAGLTQEQAAERIAARLRRIVVDPRVTVSIASRRAPKVSVVGEVQKAGHFEIGPDDGVLSALARAGGLTEFAERDGIYVLRRRPVQQRIRFSYDDLAGGDPKAVSFELRDGDIVVVE